MNITGSLGTLIIIAHFKANAFKVWKNLMLKDKKMLGANGINDKRHKGKIILDTKGTNIRLLKIDAKFIS